MSIEQEIARRRTFAVISHPDAGKTTLTEKLLLFGGGIHTAGAVKSNKITKTATSDFMEIEKQRGISVATAVMSFEYAGLLISILDTPGHKDFAEDTYRTLSAVDSVILVIDSVKGVEEQTEKLMQVCRMRNTPVMVFVNKLDREGRPPMELLDELEQKLDIAVRPLTWPIASGRRFKGVYNLHEQSLLLFRPGGSRLEHHQQTSINGLNDPALDEALESDADRLREEVELIEGVYRPFELEEYIGGAVAPVFFGSALNNFGVRELLETFVQIAPAPGPRETDTREVRPEENAFSGFVFKIHANLDPRHRDRIAFLRVCSGRFERSKQLYHVRHDRKLRFSNPYSFMAEKKRIIENAYPGDVVGLYDRGDLSIGDTLTESEAFRYRGIPRFSPNMFREVINADPMRSKQFHKGVTQLTEEGLLQLFTQHKGSRLILGTVGELQFEVIQYRLREEYGVECRFEPLPYDKGCWIFSENRTALERFIRLRAQQIAYDREQRPVFLARSEWLLRATIDENPEISFEFSSDVTGRSA